MSYNFAGGGGDQVYLLPPDPREWLPPGHLAWAVRAAVAGMDLAPFTAWYRADGQGRKAYHPQLMVMLIMYCYCKGIRSSRAVEMATYDDLGARVLAENLHPDHATVARFVSRHEQAVKGLLVASLARTGRVAGAAGTMIFLPLMFFAGLWVPRATMSAALRRAGDDTPLGAAVSALQHSMAGQWPSAGGLAVLAGYTVAFGLLAWRFFRWE